MESADFTIHNNTGNLQFEIALEGEVAYLSYRFYKKDIAFMHTFVPKVLEGRGLASALAKYAFSYAKAHQKLVMVYCPFVAKFISTHPEYNDQINQSYRGR
ncbi:GNAT family N-acetyltransferase [Pedobacter zeae]|uniref:N-acetyltransferase n=1 Tax=Pedobacter zeae TaxID=1737356 RepID=A0A7W6KAF2_9SPHI|nr:GNAT family N-acetyltransferase [Pedobacter zeae]MBB4108163.1 hypothetical protein [Pedobacter zeae]GGG94617.1 N-acetyltransferase [Pedobacter zeae]